jgi:molecular chaperone GrpE
MPNDDLNQQNNDAQVDETLDTEEFVETDEEGNELGPKDQVKKLREKLKKAVEEKQEYLTNWQKDKAEFVNARKRDEESKAEFMKFAASNIVEEILPILDSFDSAMGNAKLLENVSPEWQSGIKSIYDQLVGALSKHGVSGFGAKGEPFDPNLHQSIATTPAGEADVDHTIAEVLQKGYRLNGRVLRPALVKVFEK